MYKRLLGIMPLSVALFATNVATADRSVLIDKVVAIIDDETITRSEVLAQARPIFPRMPESERTPAKLPQLYRTLLERMIDDLVIARDAARLGLVAEQSEVDRTIDLIAEQNQLTRTQLEAEVKKQGLDRAAYEEEIRRQLVDAKWTNLKVRPRLRTKFGDKPEEQKKLIAALELERRKVLDELRAKRFVEVRW